MRGFSQICHSLFVMIYSHEAHQNHSREDGDEYDEK